MGIVWIYVVPGQLLTWLHDYLKFNENKYITHCYGFVAIYTEGDTFIY